MKDGKYGAENNEVKGGWDGMVGELVRNVSSVSTTNASNYIKAGHLLKAIYSKTN